MSEWLSALSDGYFVLGTSAGGVAIVLFLSGALLFNYRRWRQHLSDASGRINALNEDDSDIIDRIEAELPTSASLREQWAEFKEGLVFIEGTPRNTFPIDHFFGDELLGADVRFLGFTARFLDIAPTAATGCGLLGTFAGVAIALDSIDIASIETSIPKVLPALSSAFITSIIGVVGALLIEIFANRSEAKFDAVLHTLRESIDRKIVRVTPEELLHSLRHEVRQEAPLLRAQLAHLVDSSRTIQDSLRSTTGDVTLREVEQRLREGVEQQRRGADKQDETYELIQALAERVIDQLDERFGLRLEQVLAPRLERLVELIDTQVGSASEQAADQSRRFVDEMVKGLSDSMQESFQNLGNQLDVASAHLASTGADLSAVVDSARETVSRQERTMDRGRQMMADAMQDSAASSHRLENAESVMADVANLAAAIGQQQAHLLENQRSQAEIQNRTQDQLQRVMNALEDHRAKEKESQEVMARLSASMDGILSRSQTSLEDTLASLTAELGKLQVSVGSTSERAEAGATSLQKTVEMLQARLETETKLLERYQSTAQDFGDAFERGEPTVQALAATAEDLRRQQGAVEALANGLDRAGRTLHAVGEQLDGRLQTTAEEMGKAGESFGEAVTSAGEWAESTTASIERFAAGMSDAVKGSLAEYDNSLAQAVQSLSSAIKELEDVAEEMAANASKTRSGR